MTKGESTSVDMPRLFNVFSIPEIKSVRAVSSLRQEINLEKVSDEMSRARKVRTSGKEVVKFELGKGQYLLLFPSGYVQVYAPDEEGVRKVLKSFRDELYSIGLLE